jgi:hypothetical protein
MRWSAGIIVCFLFVCTFVQAQRTRYGLVKGTVIDSSTMRPLESATISVFLVSDTSLINYALTSRRGEFTVTDIPLNTPCSLLVSHSGYLSLEKTFTIPPDQKELRFDPLFLDRAVNELQAVTVTAVRPPVSVRQDTLEFNVSAFKTLPNSMVEDVLKLLPGVEVDREGNITINGKKVTRLTLDGREFFGGDPKIAIRNLPKDLIDRLQVVDNKTKESRFNKTTTGNEDLAINLTLRKDVRRGWFGRASVGYGTSDRYEAAAMMNFLNGSKQLNFIGNANNTNRGTISGEDFNISSGRSTLDGGGGGLTRAQSAGVNFGDNLGKQLKLNGSYFYNSSRTDNFSRLQRQNILPDTSFFYNAGNNSVTDYGNHRFTLNATYTIDTLTELHVNAYVNTNSGDAVTNNKAVSTGLSGQMINTSNNQYNSVSDGENLTGELFFSRRFRKQGRGFTVGVNYNYMDNKSVNVNEAENVFYKNGLVDNRDSINQQSLVTGSGDNISVTATWAEPIIKNWTVLARYTYTHNLSRNDKITNNFNKATGKYDMEAPAFTNRFRNLNEAHNLDLSLMYNKEKFRAMIGSGVQLMTQDNRSLSNDQLLHQYFINVTPSANISYHFSKSGSISVFYNGRSQQPSIQQLQPVPDNSNPLYIQQGNPDLKPAFYHNINLHARKSNGKNYWFTGLSFNTTKNQIINETYFDSVGRQVSRPVNVNGNFGFSGNLQYNYTIERKNWTLRMNLGSNGYFNSNTSFINQVRVAARSLSIAESVGMSFTYKEVLSLVPAFNIRFNKTMYTDQAVQDASFNTKTFSLSAFWNQPKRLIIENNLQYNYNSQMAEGFSKGVVMWSAAMNWLLFKKQQGVLRLAVYDILKQNAGVYRSITQISIEDRQTQILQQYFLLSFIYNLRKLNFK